MTDYVIIQYKFIVIPEHTKIQYLYTDIFNDLKLEILDLDFFIPCETLP